MGKNCPNAVHAQGRNKTRLPPCLGRTSLWTLRFCNRCDYLAPLPQLHLRTLRRAVQSVAREETANPHIFYIVPARPLHF